MFRAEPMDALQLGVAEGMDGDGEGSEGDERCGFVVT